MLPEQVGEREPLLNRKGKMEDVKEDQKDRADVCATSALADEIAAPAVLKDATDPVYEAKAQTLNGAIQAIGTYAFN